MCTIFEMSSYNNIVITKSITDYNMNRNSIKNNNIYHKVFNNVFLKCYALK